MQTNKLNNQPKRLPALGWLLIGTILFVFGQSVFFLIPEFHLENVLTSEKTFAFVSYSVIALAFWGYGWRYIYMNQAPYSHQLEAAKKLIGNNPLWFRRGLAALIIILPAVMMLFNVIEQTIFAGISGLIILLAASILAAVLLYPRLTLADWMLEVFLLLMTSTVIFLVSNNFLAASSHPFSLSWSEGNRIWDYSILFGSDRYLTPDNGKIDVFINPTRQLIWGLPFLFSGTDILGMRIWDALVKSIPSLLFALLLATTKVGDQKIESKQVVALGLWGFLFISQGPIFPQLIIPAILTVLALRSKNLWWACVLVATAGYVAVMGRFSWAYAPGLWAGMFAFLQIENPALSRKDIGRLLRPIALGISGYVGGQILASVFPISSLTRVSQSELSLFSNITEQPAFGQALLWQRWFPNPTFAPGILLALVWVITPVFILLLLAYSRNYWRPNQLQIGACLFVLLVFFGVGLVASVKIGGGGDLHNLDMFMVTMLLVTVSAWPAVLKFLDESRKSPARMLLIYLLLAVPITYLLNLQLIKPLQLPERENVLSALTRIQEQVEVAKPRGDILFMDQRQLLTFGFIQNVFLIDEYEKKYVMDKALSGDVLYFEQFYQDLANHRFSLIISEKLFIKTEDLSSPFSEENDAWVKWVSVPLLTYYKPLATLNSVGVQLLVPRR